MLALLLACSDPLPATREARPRRTDGPARDDTGDTRDTDDTPGGPVQLTYPDQRVGMFYLA
jgi:hypothetical protein